MKNAFRRRSAAAVSIVACLALSTTFSAAPGEAKPNDPKIPIPHGPTKVDRRAFTKVQGESNDASSKLSARLRGGASKTRAVFVELTGRSAAQVNAESLEKGRTRSATAKATRDRRSEVGRSAKSVAAAARQADRNAKQLFAVANGLPGVAVRTDAAARVARIAAELPVRGRATRKVQGGATLG